MSVAVSIINAVTWGKRHVVTAAEASAGTITFVGQDPGYVVGYSVNVVTTGGVNVNLADAAITYTGNATMTIANGSSTFAWVEAQVVTIIGVPVA